MRFPETLVLKLILVGLLLLSCVNSGSSSPGQVTATPSATESPSTSRGYLTTPEELRAIAHKAAQGVEPYKAAVDDVLVFAGKPWDYEVDAKATCKTADTPAWLNHERGTKRLYAKALAFHLTGNSQYAEEVRLILERIMTNALTISLSQQQCRLNFGWATPEMVASADLIEEYWHDQFCTGPLSTSYEDTTIGIGNCKALFQNWLVKNPYYVVSYTAEDSQSNWGTAATTTLAYIADYLWDRPEILLVHRQPTRLNEEEEVLYTPAQAYARANQLALDRMSGYRIEYHSNNSCDDLEGPQQSSLWPPVKSQITERGIIPEDARRQEFCNIPSYNGKYQNYPQIYLGNNIQQCELMLRRGDASCFDNIDNTDIPDFTFVNTEGVTKTTHLYPGRGSIERAINAIIVDSGTEWRHDSALEVAYRYYHIRHRSDSVEQWVAQINQPGDCDQDICFGTLSHGFAPQETPGLPPMVPPPGPS